jgi:hemolysin D
MKSAKSAKKESESTIVAFPAPRQRRGSAELAFLPAALEIVETPPSPTGRLIGGTIIALFCAALAWSILGKVDIVASASGKVIPDGRSKIIQPFETGVVRAIHVQDGQQVKTGDVLIELNSTMNGAEREHIRSDLVAAELDVARLRAALSDADDPLTEFHPPAAASPNLVAMQRQFLLNQVNEHRAKINSLRSQEAQKKAERETISATIEKLRATIPVVQERVDIRATLMAKELVSKMTYLETLQQLVEQQRDLAVQQSRYIEADAALSAMIENGKAADAEFHHTALDDLAKAEQKVAGLSQDLVKASERTDLQLLTAPIDGMVQQLAVHTVGGVVTPAQSLLVIVPTDNHLEVEAMIANQDVGFVQVGQAASIKIDTFNYTRYGLLHGIVRSVSLDAISRDKQEKPSDPNQGTQNATANTSNQDLVFAARVSLDSTQMDIDGKIVKLTPGMGVNVEIKTGSRRVIQYLLSPLLRYRHESFQER